MSKTDKRIDAYIAKAPLFAKPILTYIRSVVHEGAPECEETLKWGHPAFSQNGLLCGMLSFKEYCALHFWKGSLFIDALKGDEGAAAQLGKLTSVNDLPPKAVFLSYVKRAVELNAAGTKLPRAAAKPKAPIRLPPDLRRAIDENAKARQTYDGFSPSHRREYVEWITESKQASTRSRRIAQAVEWMAEGKPRNWKYMKTPAKGQ